MKTQDPPAGLSRRALGAWAVGGGAAMVAGLPQATAQTRPPPPEPTRLKSAGETLRPEIVGDFGIVAAGRHYAVAAGTRILMAGGNATDAGVAAVFAAAVTEISHFGFGGEAPTIIYDSGTKDVTVINGQGTAPALATPDKFAQLGMIPGNGPMGGTCHGGRHGARAATQWHHDARSGDAARDRIGRWLRHV